MSTADWGGLEKIEFDGARSLFDWCELGRNVASESGLIVVQAAQDLYLALQTIPSVEARTSPQRRARRVARHAKRAADHLRGAQMSFAKIPRVFVAEYAAEIGRMRNPGGRRPFDLKGS